MLKNKGFILSCLVLGIVVEVCLLRERIGISYLILTALFYMLFFYRYRMYPFTNKRISLLLFFFICTLTLSYFVYSNLFFNTVNLLVIPILVYCHTVLLTSQATIEWNSLSFLDLLGKKLYQMLHCFKISVRLSGRKLRRNIGESTFKTGKKILIGLLVATPLLVIVTFLLLIADEKFADLLFSFPTALFDVDGHFVFTIIKIMVLTTFFYCFFKVLTKKTVVIERRKREIRNWDTIIVTTVLLLMNIIYLLFTIVQFQYFFSGTLEPSLSYSEYARRGFFELMIVTIINYVILIGTVTFMEKKYLPFVKFLLTCLIFFSGVMLTSAFFRLMMYEQAYGFTMSRLFAHSFMIYLAIVFSFTLIKVWATQLKLSHFYLMFTLLFYVGLNIIGLDKMIVSNNIERYKQTGKIDVEYLDFLSYSAVPDIVELHKTHPDIPGLEQLLREKDKAISADIAWQSYNLSRENARQALLKR
ncbi:DUF4153 domain-containing protein [Bacillus sp. PS06]|uniref:DUF4153 domain-containing protein n=1 Tax=Bacillus sp. PS06 TaxID=2764176 RepID=UPI001780FB2B|nr:DUF4173 domain-containing protein [Bacillus sp. PS06]MBD8069031.1 DUF4173 domain-containing protein [Bacillus sp. PS06]